MAKVIAEQPRKVAKEKRYLLEFKSSTGHWLSVDDRFHRGNFKWWVTFKMWLMAGYVYDQRIVDLHSDED